MTTTETLLSIIFPPVCIMCGNLGDNLCNKCKLKLKIIDFPLCLKCDNLCIKGIPHKICKTEYSPDIFLSPFEYNKASKNIILKAKYGPKSYTILKMLIYHECSIQIIKQFSMVDLIVPAPSSSNLLSTRIINHSEYIADEIHNILNKPVYNVLQRARNSKSQKSLSGDLRRKYLAGRIKLKDKKMILKKKKVLLVDDVATTGTTIAEASKVLKLAGASNVYCYTLTKDVLHNV